MRKLQSSFLNMVLVLGGISAFAAGALGVVNELTKNPILRADAIAKEEAIKNVSPQFDNSPLDDKFFVVTNEGDSLVCYPSKLKGETIGYAIETYSDKGYSGEIKLMVGFDSDGKLLNYSVLSHKETPGLGSKISEWFKGDNKKQNILGLNPSEVSMKVSKDGGDVDGITAATISSRAFLEAVNKAYFAYMNYREYEKK